MKSHYSRFGVLRFNLLGTVLCLVAQVDSSAQEIAYEQKNGPIGDAAATFLLGDAPIEAGGGLVSGQRTTLADGSEFFLFSQSTLPGNSLAPDTNSPSTYSFSGLRLLDGDGQPALSFLGDVWLAYFTIDGVPQPMSDSFGLGISFEPLPSDPSIMASAAAYGGPPGASTDWSFVAATDALLDGMGWTGSAPGSMAAITLGSTEIGLFDIVGLSAVENDINGIHAGIALRPMPEPVSAVILISAIGAAVLSRNNRSAKGPNNWSCAVRGTRRRCF
jgi:hypothetical protein